ncbi:MAG: hypothetical protein KDJ75_04110 [Alphaproteobacteria bacterium]|nr:hypothetical protein [Alphaproteobacteria bacterium]
MPKDDFNKLTTMLENFSPSTLKTGDTLLRTIFLLNAEQQQELLKHAMDLAGQNEGGGPPVGSFMVQETWKKAVNDSGKRRQRGHGEGTARVNLTISPAVADGLRRMSKNENITTSCIAEAIFKQVPAIAEHLKLGND